MSFSHLIAICGLVVLAYSIGAIKLRHGPALVPPEL